MSKTTLHPCLSCPLPDCNEMSPACSLKRALYAYRRCLMGKDTMTDEIRERRRIAYSEFYGAHRTEMNRAKRLAATHVQN